MQDHPTAAPEVSPMPEDGDYYGLVEWMLQSETRRKVELEELARCVRQMTSEVREARASRGDVRGQLADIGARLATFE